MDHIEREIAAALRGKLGTRSLGELRALERDDLYPRRRGRRPTVGEWWRAERERRRRAAEDARLHCEKLRRCEWWGRR